MGKYTVRLMTDYAVWEDVEAKGEADAIRQCSYPPEFDVNESHEWIAREQESEDFDEEDQD